MMELKKLAEMFGNVSHGSHTLEVSREDVLAWNAEAERLRRENVDLADFIRGVARQLLERAKAGG